MVRFSIHIVEVAAADLRLQLAERVRRQSFAIDGTDHLHGDADALHGAELVRISAEQDGRTNAERSQHRAGELVVAAVGGKSERLVPPERVRLAKGDAAELVQKSDSPSFLPQVDDD